MVPQDPVVIAPKQADLHRPAMWHFAPSCEQLDRRGCRSGRAHSHGRRLGEAGRPDVRHSSQCREGAPPLRCDANRGVQQQSGTRPSGRSSTPRIERSGAPTWDSCDRKVVDVLVRTLVLGLVDMGIEPDEPSREASQQADEARCDDVAEAHSIEAWELELGATLLRGIRPLDEQEVEDDGEGSKPAAWKAGLRVALQGALDGLPRLSAEDHVEVLDLDAGSQDVAHVQLEDQCINQADVDGMVNAIFHQAVMAVRTEVYDEFGMESQACSDVEEDSEELDREGAFEEKHEQVAALEAQAEASEATAAMLLKSPSKAASTERAPAMVRSLSAGRLRPQHRESIMSFRLDAGAGADDDEAPPRLGQPGITRLFAALGASRHRLDGSRTSSRAASPAGVQMRRSAPSSVSSHVRAAAVHRSHPAAHSSDALASKFRAKAPVSNIVDRALKVSAKTGSSSVEALKEVGNKFFAVAERRSKRSGQKQPGLVSRSSSLIGL